MIWNQKTWASGTPIEPDTLTSIEDTIRLYDKHGHFVKIEPVPECINGVESNCQEHTHSSYENESEQSEEFLDDPYLELFDRINQLEMDVKELSAKFDKYIDVTQKQRAYDTWVLRGMPVGGAAMGDGGVKNINAQQSEFKFFE